MEILIDPNVPQQAPSRVLELYAAGYGSSTGLPVNPDGYAPGGSYSETSLETPTGEVLRWLYYTPPGDDSDPLLVGQAPPSRS